MNLKIVQAVYAIVTAEPGHPYQYPYIVLMARVSSRPSSLDEGLYPEGKGKNINDTKINW